MRLPVLLAAAALALAGCNANQTPWSPAGSDPIYWSPAGGNPSHYAQTSGYYAGFSAPR
jgi:hypothetical protein